MSTDRGKADLPLLKGFAAKLGIGILPWQGHWYRRAIADVVEYEATVAHALALGADETKARQVVKGLRRETAWSWGRIRDELTRTIPGGLDG